jgi:hypothetical protein
VFAGEADDEACDMTRDDVIDGAEEESRVGLVVEELLVLGA